MNKYKINSVEYSLLVDNINFGTSNVVTGIFKFKNRQRHLSKNSIMQLWWRAILAKKINFVQKTRDFQLFNQDFESIK